MQTSPTLTFSGLCVLVAACSSPGAPALTIPDAASSFAPDAAAEVPDAASTAGEADAPPSSGGQPDAAPQGSDDPLVTPVGDDLYRGQAMATIGAAGGTLSADGGRVTLVVPPGALDSDQDILIMPVVNQTPGGVGVGYRLGPDGLTFAVPASLTLTLTADDAAVAPASIVREAVQDDQGRWVDEPVTRDVTAGTVTADLAHFSYHGFYAPMGIGGPRAMFADQTDGLEITTDVPDVRGFLAAPAHYRGPATVMWNLNGSGSLSDNDFTALYTPANPPGTDRVLVTALVFPAGGEPVVLGAFIHILAREYRLDADFTVIWTCGVGGGPGNAFATTVHETGSGTFQLDDAFEVQFESSTPEVTPSISDMTSCLPAYDTFTALPAMTPGFHIGDMHGEYDLVAGDLHVELEGQWSDFPAHIEHDVGPPPMDTMVPTGPNPLDLLDPFLRFTATDGNSLDDTTADASRAVELELTLHVLRY